MRVYFYDNSNISKIHKEWKQGKYPGQFLYGATHLHKYGVELIMHKYDTYSSDFKRAVSVAWQILTCKEDFEAVYAAHTKGLGILAFLRAIRVFRKPIIVWHQRPISRSEVGFKELGARLFYAGIDRMFFLSDAIMRESILSGKVSRERAQVVHWGADLGYYNRIMSDNPDVDHRGFISTGKERRDMPTLIRAFSATGQRLSIYIAYNACGNDYLQILNDLRPSANINVNFTSGLIPHELAQKVWQARCVVVCCEETNYTTGLTATLEAMALGLPVVCTRNVNYPFDVDAEGVGISMPYYESVAWETTIRNLVKNPDEAVRMGRNARKLAEEVYNLENCTREVAEAIKDTVHSMQH